MPSRHECDVGYLVVEIKATSFEWSGQEQNVSKATVHTEAEMPVVVLATVTSKHKNVESTSHTQNASCLAHLSDSCSLISLLNFSLCVREVPQYYNYTGYVT